MVTKWAGSIEIGVTTHAPSDLEFPSTMTNVGYLLILYISIEGDDVFTYILSGEVRDLDDDRERCYAQWNDHRRRLRTESRQAQGAWSQSPYKETLPTPRRGRIKEMLRLAIVWLW